jgi:hypothetical protein
MRNLALIVLLAVSLLNFGDAADVHMRGNTGQLEIDDRSRYLITDDSLEKQQAAYEELEFAKRFNNLVRAMREFSVTYKGGHVIDVKRAKAIRKAIHDLEKSDWFHAETSD